MVMSGIQEIQTSRQKCAQTLSVNHHIGTVKGRKSERKSPVETTGGGWDD